MIQTEKIKKVILAKKNLVAFKFSGIASNVITITGTNLNLDEVFDIFSGSFITSSWFDFLIMFALAGQLFLKP